MRKEAEVRNARRTTYFLLVMIALSITAGRIATVINQEGTAAFQSANDRSRWATVSALVEDHTYVIDRQINLRDTNNKSYLHTIDMVRHRGDDGKLHYYSSKPPLLASMVAVVYGGVNMITGLTLTEHPIYATRVVLMLVNLPLLLIFYAAMLTAIELIGAEDWSRRVLAVFVCFGTLVTPFAISLNNHLPAAAATAVTLAIYLYLAEKIDLSQSGTSRAPHWSFWFAGGACAAFTAANELPALSMMCLWVVLFYQLNRDSWLPTVAGIAVVMIAFFGTNYLAHESWRPPYAHRGTGAVIGDVEGGDAEDARTQVKTLLTGAGELADGETFVARVSDEEGRVVIETSDARLFAMTPKNKVGGYRLAYWDDWYEYPKSYWQKGRRKGVDLGEPSYLVYLANMTIGHHGIFSLTPLWLLLPIGLLSGLTHGPKDFRRLTRAVLLASAVCFLFYLVRPEIDRNYGGVSIGFRWLIWFAPLWIVMIVPVTDELSESKRGMAAYYVMLALSIFTVAVSWDSPWQHPWIYRFWYILGWIG